jgi:hypothetical protein
MALIPFVPAFSYAPYTGVRFTFADGSSVSADRNVVGSYRSVAIVQEDGSSSWLDLPSYPQGSYPPQKLHAIRADGSELSEPFALDGSGLTLFRVLCIHNWGPNAYCPTCRPIHQTCTICGAGHNSNPGGPVTVDL